MKMLGKSCPEGPGGRDCACCGQPPGPLRRAARRYRKRRENQQWRREEDVNAYKAPPKAD